MASSSKAAKGKESHEIQLVSNEVKQPKFRPIPKVAYKNDPTSALSSIPNEVVMVQDVQKMLQLQNRCNRRFGNLKCL